jgi:hypothetical protein
LVSFHAQSPHCCRLAGVQHDESVVCAKVVSLDDITLNVMVQRNHFSILEKGLRNFRAVMFSVKSGTFICHCQTSRFTLHFILNLF